RRLGETVALEDLDSHAIEKSQDLRRNRGRATDADQQLVEAEGCADLLEDQAVGERPLPAQHARKRTLGLIGGGASSPDAERPIANQCARTMDRIHPLADAGIDLFPKSR